MPNRLRWLLFLLSLTAIMALYLFASEYVGSAIGGKTAENETPSGVTPKRIRLLTDAEVQQITAITPPVLPRGSSPERRSSPAAATTQATSQKRPRTPYDPLSPEGGGDARQINPEEIRWLQDRLDLVPRGALPGTLQPALALSSQISAYRYQTANEGWIEPAITDQRQYGDCAAKSLWLATRLIAAGYRGVSIVIGVPPTYRAGEPGHAWVEMQWKQSHFVFEPTTQSQMFIPETAPTRRHEVVARVYPWSSLQ